MKTGLTLQELATELDAQRHAAQDVIVNTKNLTMLTPRDRKTGGAPELHLPEGLGEFTLAHHAERQLCDRIWFPWKVWQKFRENHPDMLDYNVNELLRREPENRMVRTFDWSQVPGREAGGKITRAFLSDRYRRMDNYDLLDKAILPTVKELVETQGARIESCSVTESKMYIKVVFPKIEGEVKKNDVVQAGVVIKNSEVGDGSLSVQPITFRLVCLNGMVLGKATRQFHLGRQQGDSDNVFTVLSDEARAADDEALWLKLRDVVKASADETKFNSMLAHMREATDTPAMEEPVKGCEILSKDFGLTEKEHHGMLQHLLTDGDLTLYGAANAVTRMSQDVSSYDRASELEEIGGDVLRMGRRAWERVAVTA
jgi:hypothetical protein